MRNNKRSFRVILVAHCILNQNSRVFGLARYGGAINEVVDILKEKNFGIIQIPCPELSFAGLNRPSQTKGQYDTPEYREHCRKIAIEIVNQIKAYQKNNFKIPAILGVSGSPSCSKSGIFIEALERELKDAKIYLHFFEVDTDKIEETIIHLKRIL